MNILLSIILFFGLSTAFASGPSYTSKAKVQFTTPAQTTVFLEMGQVCSLGNGLLKSKAPVEYCSKRDIVESSLVCVSKQSGVLLTAQFTSKLLCVSRYDNRTCQKSKVVIEDNTKGFDRTYRNGELVVTKPVEIELCN